MKKIGSDRLYGIVADENYLCVCEYGAEGTVPEIMVFKRRKLDLRERIIKMIFEDKKITLKNGVGAVLRSPKDEETKMMLDYIIKASGETDFLTRYPEEWNYDVDVVHPASQ